MNIVPGLIFRTHQVWVNQVLHDNEVGQNMQIHLV
jgi:hypothetical protein